ncbi:MAG: Zn-ribbon domain-containing OB-fold protein [Sphingopyxis sp.]|uniref:Zn-ribbon domain-containing OB-fold protein n=1 Tax=Sphingopyxis sp. TaxID=1908224 RepID=UPI003D6D6218
MIARTLPVIDRDNQAYWTWGRDGKLAIHRCAACEYYVHPPVPFCPRCESRDVAPQAVSGRGRVVTFTINHKAWVPELTEPYVLALVAIAEQDDVRIPCNIVDCAPDAVDFDMEVEVVFEQTEDLWVPLFRPVTA